MKLLEEFLAEQSKITIQMLASYIQQYVQEQWQPMLQKGQCAHDLFSPRTDP